MNQTRHRPRHLSLAPGCCCCHPLSWSAVVAAVAVAAATPFSHDFHHLRDGISVRTCVRSARQQGKYNIKEDYSFRLSCVCVCMRIWQQHSTGRLHVSGTLVAIIGQNSRPPHISQMKVMHPILHFHLSVWSLLWANQVDKSNNNNKHPSPRIGFTFSQNVRRRNVGAWVGCCCCHTAESPRGVGITLSAKIHKKPNIAIDNEADRRQRNVCLFTDISALRN